MGLCCKEWKKTRKNVTIRDIVKQVPADYLVDIYGDKEDRLSDKSDADEGRGVGTNLDKYTGYEFSTCDAVERWME